MIEIYKMNKLYDVVVNEIKIDKNQLKHIGIADEELTKLIKDDVLELTTPNEYKFTAVNKLLHYANELKQEGNITKALKCLITCQKLFPENRQVLLHLLLIYIRQNKQEEIYNILKLLDITDDKNSISENNLILYLLEQVNKIPKEYRERVKKIELDDLIIKNIYEYQNPSAQNRMRKHIIERKFNKADTVMRNELNGCFRYQIEKEVIFTLLTQTIELKKKINIYIKTLIDNKNYSQLASYLEKKHSIKKLNLYEAYLYKISSAIIRIKKVNKIPKATITETTSLKDAIIGNNYRLALKLINQTTPELTNQEEVNNVLTLLKTINSLITQIIKESQETFKQSKDNEEKDFLLKELNQMKESNKIIKFLENIDESRKQKLIQVAKTIPEISLIIPKYKNTKIILRTVTISDKTSNKENLSEKALNAYISGDYKLAALIYSKIIQTEHYIKAYICGMLGLSYLHLSDIEKAIHYMTISIELDRGHKENKIDYKTLIQYLEEPTTETTQEKISHIVNKHDAKLIEYNFSKEEELAYYITSENMTLKSAKEKLNLTDEQILLIKLIYARDYYSEEDYSQGDNLVKEVANNKNNSLVVVSLLTEVRRNRNSYKNITNNKRKKLTQNQ